MCSKHLPLPVLLCSVAMLLTGCDDAASSATSPKVLPRPVSVFKLVNRDPIQTQRITGAVGSWKTEEVGFEVAGRVEFVIEPDTGVEGYLEAAQQAEKEGEGSADIQTHLKRGPRTLLARLDVERYQLRVQSARADIRTTERQKQALQIEIKSVMPAQQRAAVAGQKLAKSQLDRAARLFQQEAATQDQLDKSQADFDTADAAVAQVDAELESKKAESTALDAKIEQLQNTLAEAIRDVEDCNLYSSFRGQAAEIHVIQGGYVDRGQKVVTIQMMNPIKVEFEVSASTARRLNYKDEVSVVLERMNAAPLRLPGIVYMTDTTADPATRTFTVTVLLHNHKTKTEVPKQLQDGPVVITRDLWTVSTGPPQLGEDRQFVEQSAIHRDEQGHFLWRARRIPLQTDEGTVSRRRSPLLEISKLRITRKNRIASFLTHWTFEEIQVHEGQEFDPSRNVVTGKVEVPPGAPEPKDGDMILFERESWLMRPGDLVEVDLSGADLKSGFYVPLDAVREEPGKKYVFAVTGTKGGKSKAVEIPVTTHEELDTLVRISAEGKLSDGMQLIVGGLHYIQNEDEVTVAQEVKTRK